LLRPVTVRAARTAPMTASEPVVQNVTRSIPDNRHIVCAISPASAFWGPISMPVASCFSIARRMNSGLCPNKYVPKPMVTSRNSLPSKSQILEPAERTDTIGYVSSFHVTRKPDTARGSEK
jgi:hypothetical protein